MSDRPEDYAADQDNPLTFSVSHQLGKEVVAHFAPLSGVVVEDEENALELAYKNKNLEQFC